MSECISSFYKIYPWPELLEEKEGKRRFEEALENLKLLLSHEWFRNILSRKSRVRILDLCGGTGLGGIALCKLLSLENVDFELIVCDIRREALVKAEDYARSILGVSVRTLTADARRINDYVDNIDVILMYGFSTVHFNPWDMVRLIHATSHILSDIGIFVVEEMDRIYKVFYKEGYEKARFEGKKFGHIIVSFHLGYDYVKGTFRRKIVDMSTKDYTLIDLYFWNIASLAALMWVFYEDVDFIEVSERDLAGYIIARGPRKITLKGLENTPTILRRSMHLV